MVGADAHGDAAAPCRDSTSGENLSRMRPSSASYWSICVFPDRELLLVRVVARVDADLLHPFRGLHRRFGLEMDVCHERHVAALLAETTGDSLEICRVLDRRGRDADDLTSNGGELERLDDAFFGVHRIAGDHRLHTDGIVSADPDSADAHLSGLTARIGVGATTILKAHLVCSDTSFCRVANMSPTSKKVT